MTEHSEQHKSGTFDYEHESVRKLAELYEQHKDEMGKGMGMMSLLWKALAPSIPDILIGLDQDEELLQKIYRFLNTVVSTLKEDIGGEDSAEGDLS